MKVLSDDEIARLISEPKGISRKLWRKLMPSKQNSRGHLVNKHFVTSDMGKAYEVYTRQNPAIPNDYSTGLVYLPRAKQSLILIRCNGWHAPHDNVLELKARTGIQTIPANTCHVHRATYRYMDYFGPEKMAQYAEPTSEYSSLQQAVEYLLETFDFYLTDGRGWKQLRPLFHQKETK